MDKVDCFKEELSYIKNENIKKFATAAVNEMPEYFFHVAASSTGKYHPSYALGEGGLLRHTKAAVRIAIELLRLEMFNHFSNDEKDLIIVALILHDSYKHGTTEKYSNYTITEHPLVAEEQIRFNPNLQNIIPDSQMFLITEGIVTHMGQWCFDYKTKRNVLPKPHTKMQNFIHIADYLASRKMLEVNFDVPLE